MFNTLPDGSTGEGTDNFIVSAAETDGPFAIVTEITDLGGSGDENRTLSATILSRLPDLADTWAMTDTTSGQ